MKKSFFSRQFWVEEKTCMWITMSSNRELLTDDLFLSSLVSTFVMLLSYLNLSSYLSSKVVTFVWWFNSRSLMTTESLLSLTERPAIWFSFPRSMNDSIYPSFFVARKDLCWIFFWGDILFQTQKTHRIVFSRKAAPVLLCLRFIIQEGLWRIEALIRTANCKNAP